MTDADADPFRPTAAPARPFLDWPVVTDPGQWQPAVAAVLGVPQSEPYPGDACPNDQTRAPAAIRQQSALFCDGPEHWDFHIGSELARAVPGRCIDAGDIVWAGGSYDAHAARVTALTARLIGAGTRVFALGGDHGVTIPLIDALEAVGQSVHLVQIDAHLDWREEVGGVRRGYSSPMRWASRRPWIGGMTQIGLRGTGSARRAEVEAALAYGAQLITAEEVHEGGIAPVLERIPSDRPIYVTVDADGFDPSEMPGVLGPVPGGLRFSQVAPLLRRLARRQRVVGMDVVEVAPGFDAANAITCIAAGRLIVNVLAAAVAG
jgi:agmatinase